MSTNPSFDRQHLCMLLVAALVAAPGCLSPAGTPADGETVTIDHAAGTTEVPAEVEDVVVLEWTYAENLLALGLEPAGVADTDGYETWVSAGPSLSGDVTDVGTRQEPSLEAIARLDPDLIVGVDFRHETTYDQLSSIAPTILFDPYPAKGEGDQLERMEEDLETLGKALDREQAAEDVLADMEASFQEAADRIEAVNRSGEAVTVAQAYTGEGSPVIRLFTSTSVPGTIAERVGLRLAWEDDYQEFGFSTVGLEALERVEEATFLYVAQPDDDPINDTYADDPAWQNLTFVEEERVHPLGADTWLFGGPLSAELVADRVADRLAG